MFLSEDRQWPVPATNPENASFFAAAAEGRLLIGRCEACGKAHYYPRRSCPHCFSDRVDWQPASGRGHIHTYTVAAAASDRQVLAFIDLEEGVRMLSNLVDAPAARLAGGAAVAAPVRVAFARAGTVCVPVFVLDEERA